MSETLRRGLSNIFIAEVTKDDNAEGGGYTAGTPEQLFPAGEMTRTVESDKAPVYFDNAVFYMSGREGNTEVSITGADIRANKLARILGKYIDETTGAVYDTGEYVEKYYALGGTAHKVDGTEEKFWFMKGTFAIPELSDKTIDDSTDTSGLTIVFSAQRTIHKFEIASGVKNGLKQVCIDTETTELKAEQTWEAQVVTPEIASTVIQKKAE